MHRPVHEAVRHHRQLQRPPFPGAGAALGAQGFGRARGGGVRGGQQLGGRLRGHGARAVSGGAPHRQRPQSGFCESEQPGHPAGAGRVRAAAQPRHRRQGRHLSQVHRVHGCASRGGGPGRAHDRRGGQVSARVEARLPVALGGLLQDVRAGAPVPALAPVQPLPSGLPRRARGARGGGAGRGVHVFAQAGAGRDRPARRRFLHVRRGYRPVVAHRPGRLQKLLLPAYHHHPLQGREHEEGQPQLRAGLLPGHDHLCAQAFRRAQGPPVRVDAAGRHLLPRPADVAGQLFPQGLAAAGRCGADGGRHGGAQELLGHPLFPQPRLLPALVPVVQHSPVHRGVAGQPLVHGRLRRAVSLAAPGARHDHGHGGAGGHLWLFAAAVPALAGPHRAGSHVVGAEHVGAAHAGAPVAHGQSERRLRTRQERRDRGPQGGECAGAAVAQPRRRPGQHHRHGGPRRPRRGQPHRLPEQPRQARRGGPHLPGGRAHLLCARRAFRQNHGMDDAAGARRAVQDRARRQPLDHRQSLARPCRRAVHHRDQLPHRPSDGPPRQTPLRPGAGRVPATDLPPPGADREGWRRSVAQHLAGGAGAPLVGGLRRHGPAGNQPAPPARGRAQPARCPAHPGTRRAHGATPQPAVCKRLPPGR